MSGFSGDVIAIDRQDGDKVVVSIPMVGFFPNQQLRPGSLVFITHGPNGPIARPLTRAVSISGEARREANRVVADNREYAVDASTHFEESPNEEGYVFVVPNERGESENVLSVRQPGSKAK